MSRYSATRWLSKREVVNQGNAVFRVYLLGIGPARQPKLLAFFSDPQTRSKLQIEIAATVDWHEPFVKALYCFEGDDPLAQDCY